MAEGTGRGKAARIAQEVLRRALMPASYLIAGLGCGVVAVATAEGSHAYLGHDAPVLVWSTLAGAFILGAAILGRRG